MYYMCAGTILGITDYFWRVSPSDKKTVKLCQSWVDYANAMQPYHQKIPFGAASMSYRLGNFKRAEQILLESQKLQQEELKVKLAALDAADTYGVVLRAKGMVAGDDGQWIYFDMVPGEYEIREGEPDYTGRLCVIGTHIDEHRLEELFGIA